MIGAIAAVIGGKVVFGSNLTTSVQTTTVMKAAESGGGEISREYVEVLPPDHPEIIPADERASLATSAPARACSVARAGTRRIRS
jgi:hypothetical protein